VKDLLRDRRRLSTAVAVVCLLLVLAVTLHLLSPRTTGLEGDWSAKAVAGPVVAGRAVLSGDHTALDLRTGKTVTLGSVRGGTPYVADDRLLVASQGQVDSARLDATARWTWRAPAGTTVIPVAASGGSTIVLACPAKGSCRLVGLDAQGKEGWSADGANRREPLPSGGLPRVDATSAGGGVLVTDPASGRSSLQPGRSFLALPDGPVVTEVVQEGRCVVAAYVTADPAWTHVLPTCPAGETPRLSVDPTDSTAVTITWPSLAERLELATGKTATAEASNGKDEVVARAGGLTATLSSDSLHTNPFRWGKQVTVLGLRDERTGDLRAQVVSDRPLRILHLDAGSVVVRDGDAIVRYTLDDR
jgi:hypothetical protein